MSHLETLLQTGKVICHLEDICLAWSECITNVWHCELTIRLWPQNVMEITCCFFFSQQVLNRLRIFTACEKKSLHYGHICQYWAEHNNLSLNTNTNTCITFKLRKKSWCREQIFVICVCVYVFFLYFFVFVFIYSGILDLKNSFSLY